MNLLRRRRWRRGTWRRRVSRWTLERYHVGPDVAEITIVRVLSILDRMIDDDRTSSSTRRDTTAL